MVLVVTALFPALLVAIMVTANAGGDQPVLGRDSSVTACHPPTYLLLPPAHSQVCLSAQSAARLLTNKRTICGQIENKSFLEREEEE